MKKLIFLSSLLGFSTAALAQLPVSTSVENKNAVLEEFTGIYCTFCPDGHALANAFAASNPGDVVLINIHTGSYAVPSGSDPDFQTAYGADIAGQSGLAGYPAGTMNRRVFSGHQQASGTAQSRGSWATTGAMVIGESSYANVAIEAEIDFTTNQLIVDVETYFTGTSPVTTAKLNVAVLQSNVEGPQTGMAANPAQVLPNGNYLHNHMLRELLTGQWGADIATAMNTVGTYQYVWNIPNDINGIPVSLGDLEVAAFIVEGQQNIVTGATGPVTYTLPPGMSLADAAAVNSWTVPAGFCNTSVTPEVTVENLNSFAMDSCEVMATIGSTTSSVWALNIPANGTQVVTFPSMNLSTGENNISFSVSVANVAKYADLNSSNNTASESIITISPNPFATTHFEGFEGNTIGDAVPNNAIQVNPNGSRVFVVDNQINSTVNWPLGAYENSAKSYRYDFYTAPAGDVIDLVFEKMDLSSTTGNTIRFDYAYAQYTTENDALEVLVSDDCGATWSSVWNKAGADLSTANATTDRFYPVGTEWQRWAIDISAYDGTAELLVMFRGTSAEGNSLYVDDIHILNSTNVSLEEKEMLSSVNVYPNPAVETTNVEFELTNTTMVSVKLTDITGKLIAQPLNGSLEAGKHNTALNVSNLDAGVYMVEITLDGNSKIEKLIVE